ncbi:MAG: hypothetical protein ACREHE_09600 [Rhizomicrobium sp.]
MPFGRRNPGFSSIALAILAVISGMAVWERFIAVQRYIALERAKGTLDPRLEAAARAWQEHAGAGGNGGAIRKMIFAMMMLTTGYSVAIMVQRAIVLRRSKETHGR